MALVAILLTLAACSAGDAVGENDFVKDSKGERQLTQVEYDALKEFIEAADRVDASGVPDSSVAQVSVNGTSYEVYWHYLCPNGDRANALRVASVSFTRDHNQSADLADVIRWAEQHDP